MDIPLKQLKRLLETLDEGGASEFEYEDEKVRLRIALARGAMPHVAVAPATALAGAPAPAREASSPVASSKKDDSGDPSVAFVTSPFVGTFYRSPSPDADPFVQIG